MIYIMFIVAILFAILTIVFIVKDKDTLGFMCFILFFASMTAFIIVGCLSDKDVKEIESNNIPAIDVYRGNTTLEITYKDNIPVDSVVVYKNK